MCVNLQVNLFSYVSAHLLVLVWMAVALAPSEDLQVCEEREKGCRTSCYYGRLWKTREEVEEKRQLTMLVVVVIKPSLLFDVAVLRGDIGIEWEESQSVKVNNSSHVSRARPVCRYIKALMFMSPCLIEFTQFWCESAILIRINCSLHLFWLISFSSPLTFLLPWDEFSVNVKQQPFFPLFPDYHIVKREDSRKEFTVTG